MFSSRSHDRVPQLAVLLAIGVTAWLLLTRIAHAGVGAADPSPPGIDWTFWSMLAIAVGTGLSLVLHAVAPRTKTTIDDRFRDDLDEILAFVRGSTIPGKPLAPPAPPPGSGTAAMLVAVLFSVAVGVGVGVMPSCTASQARQAAAAGVVAMLECEDGHLDAQALADAKVFAAAEVEHWLAGGVAPSPSALLTDLAPIKSDLGRCAIAAAMAAATALVTPAPAPGVAIAALATWPKVDPAQMRGAFAVAARQLGWQPVKVAGGTVW